MYIYHPRGVFLAGYDWFERKVVYFNIQICVYHILFTEETIHYVIAEGTDLRHFDGIDLILL